VILIAVTSEPQKSPVNSLSGAVLHCLNA